MSLKVILDFEKLQSLCRKETTITTADLEFLESLNKSLEQLSNLTKEVLSIHANLSKNKELLLQLDITTLDKESLYSLSSQLNDEITRRKTVIKVIPTSIIASTTDKNVKVPSYTYDITSQGDRVWKKDGWVHRDDDLPAMERANGDKFWYQDGKCHRDNDKPALECADGEKRWYKEGNLHRDNDKPAVEYANGEKHWYKNGHLHRDNDLPAVEYANGQKSWYKNGQMYKKLKITKF